MTLDIPALRAKYDAATKGEWVDHWDDVSDRAEDEQQVISSSEASLDGTVIGLMGWNNGPDVVIRKEDAAFITAAHAAFPELLAMAEASEAKRGPGWNGLLVAQLREKLALAEAEKAVMAERLAIVTAALAAVTEAVTAACDEFMTKSNKADEEYESDEEALTAIVELADNLQANVWNSACNAHRTLAAIAEVKP